jgi:hypothetical protein
MRALYAVFLENYQSSAQAFFALKLGETAIKQIVGGDWERCGPAPEGNDEGWLVMRENDDDGRDGTCGVARTGQQRSARKLRTSWYLGPWTFGFLGRDPCP